MSCPMSGPGWNGAITLTEWIEADGKHMALIVRRDDKVDGIKFLTPDDFSQQVGLMTRPAGYRIPPHVHRPVRREVEITKEVLFIRSGRMRIDFYDEHKVFLCSREVATGDTVLLAYGGHGIEMLEPTDILEVKQGPYAGERDKERFVDPERQT
jgi:mannose-6-phosphate isomerase-like protein (cupin superfamily)